MRGDVRDAVGHLRELRIVGVGDELFELGEHLVEFLGGGGPGAGVEFVEGLVGPPLGRTVSADPPTDQHANPLAC